MVGQNQLILKNEIIDKLLKHMTKIKEFGVAKIGVFGSLLTGETTGDIDILISFKENEESFEKLVDLYYFLEDLLNAPIDLVTTNALSPYIAPYILREVEYIEAF
jgi:predicted nucleotidyltransferase